jgi:hypothetical protein
MNKQEQLPKSWRVGGILESWMKIPWADTGDYVVMGYIYGDPVWRSGSLLRTSIVQKIEGNFLYTLNSVYRLGNNYMANKR